MIRVHAILWLALHDLQVRERLERVIEATLTIYADLPQVTSRLNSAGLLTLLVLKLLLLELQRSP